MKMAQRNPTWACKIGVIGDLVIDDGADLPMRAAVEAAFAKVTGATPQFTFSGWDASLEEQELAVVENRPPSLMHHQQWLAREAGPELLEALKSVAGVVAMHANLESYEKVLSALAKAQLSEGCA